MDICVEEASRFVRSCVSYTYLSIYIDGIYIYRHLCTDYVMLMHQVYGLLRVPQVYLTEVVRCRLYSFGLNAQKNVIVG